jgi:hypothetical protein
MKKRNKNVTNYAASRYGGLRWYWYRGHCWDNGELMPQPDDDFNATFSLYLTHSARTNAPDRPVLWLVNDVRLIYPRERRKPLARGKLKTVWPLFITYAQML